MAAVVPRLLTATAIGIAAAWCDASPATVRHGGHDRVSGIPPKVQCEALGKLDLGPDVTILSTATKTANNTWSCKPMCSVTYCEVDVLVGPGAIHIDVGLPSDGSWNGIFQATGGSGYVGHIHLGGGAMLDGYVGATTDTGHTANTTEFPGMSGISDGRFGMLRKGVPNTQAQIDFAFRSEHMMAVVSKQLISSYYGPGTLKYSYWNGCSTGGRQGLMMAQRYPDDYDGVVAGSSAIHWCVLGLKWYIAPACCCCRSDLLCASAANRDKFQAYQIWPQMVMWLEAGGPIAPTKLEAATNASVAACDLLDGVKDGIIRDPRECKFDATALVCKPGVTSARCLTAGEAIAINKIWGGATNAKGELLWYGIKPGAPMVGKLASSPRHPGDKRAQALANALPFEISVEQPKYWVYLDPDWDWHSLTYANYASFFDKTIQMVEKVIGTDDADLRSFRDRGSKLLMWHGWADPLIMPQGSIDYYDEVVTTVSNGNMTDVQQFARLFMFPGVEHCGGGAGFQMGYGTPLEILRRWVEDDIAPDLIVGNRTLADGKVETRPACAHPKVAFYRGVGSTSDAANFECRDNTVQDNENAAWRGNERVFGVPFFRPNDTHFPP